MKTITLSELKVKSFCNSKDIVNAKVIIHGIVHEWVGIGWVELDKATKQEKELYPTVVDG